MNRDPITTANSPPNYQLSSPHTLKRKRSLLSRKVLSVSRLCYWYMPPPPPPIAPGFQPPLKSDKRSECWMVIFYWQEVGSARRGHGGWGTLEIREGTQFLVRTKGDKMVLSAELQPNLTRGKAFWCVLDCVQVFLRSCLPFINSPPTHG